MALNPTIKQPSEVVRSRQNVYFGPQYRTHKHAVLSFSALCTEIGDIRITLILSVSFTYTLMSFEAVSSLYCQTFVLYFVHTQCRSVLFVFCCLWDEAASPHVGLLKAFRELFATSPQLGFCPHGYKTVSRIIQRLLHLTLLRVH